MGSVHFMQIGADVPAESFKLSPVDRIFVRMGAKDQIMAGHSTFLTELLETASMLVRWSYYPMELIRVIYPTKMKTYSNNDKF